MTAWLITNGALADLQDIQSYGEERWGERQSRRYLEELYHLFDLLVISPGIGSVRPELNQTIRAFPHTSHMVFFVPWDATIIVSRVLHAAMDYRPVLEGYAPLEDLFGA